MRRSIGVVLALATAQLPQQPFNQRPADVTIVMSTSRGKYDGTYAFNQVAQVCGEVPKELNFAGVAGFLVQFPDDAGNGQISDVTFASPQLVGGVTTATKFHLSISVKSPRIGSPESYVLDPSQPKMVGTAALSSPSPGVTQLKVIGVNDRGESIDLTMICRANKR